MEVTEISVSKLALNRGQIAGVPKNPRFIRDERFESLKKSITDFPDGLELRELIVYPQDGKYVVLGGNMRLRACKELGYKVMPCKVVDAATEPETLRRIVVMDNASFGQNDWDMLANEWDTTELEDFGIELDYLNPDFLPDSMGKEGGRGEKGAEREEDILSDKREENNESSNGAIATLTFDSEGLRDQFVAMYGETLKTQFGCSLSLY